jgi:hypothetical protein
MDYAIGLDLGQAQDYTALAVVNKYGDQQHVIDLRRWPLGTAYTAIADDVQALMWHRSLHRNALLLVDAGGPGRPVLDLLTERATPWEAVAITSGMHARREVHHGAVWHSVPKRDLITRLQVQLQNRTLRIAAALDNAAVLVNELENYQVKVTPHANETFNAREGQHDDLVLAVALASWGAHVSAPLILWD